MSISYPVSYSVRLKNPAAHLFEVQCVIKTPETGGQHISLPAWIPGSYLIRDFARHVQGLKAECAGKPLAVEKIDKDSWACAPCQGLLTLTYEVYAWDLSVRGAHLDTTHAYFNGACMFVRVHGQDDQPCQVHLHAPASNAYENWRVATAMTRASAEPYGFGTYRADNYDELIDHPVEMGVFSLASFQACGVPHDIVITGRHWADLERLCRDLKILCEYHIRFFGEPAPMQRYVFLITAVGDGYGGLEHRASSSLLCKREHLPRAEEVEVSDEYRGFLGLVSHEYFHSWHVKRIKPQVFMPYDLQRETYTRLLWVFEGITSYYDDLALVRCGLISAQRYLQVLSETITRVWRGHGRFKQTLAESSFDAWTKFYKQDENSPNAIVSYYTKGALVALALDLSLRQLTQGKKSLDDVMGLLWRRYGLPAIGVPEDVLETLVEELAGQGLQSFFQKTVYGTEDPPLADLLMNMGVEFTLRPAESDRDAGGRAAQKSPATLAARTVLGVRLSDGAECKLAQVFDNGAAQAAGLAAGDVLVAVDGLKVTRQSLEKMLLFYRPNALLPVHVFRRDELMLFEVTLQAAPVDTCVLNLQPASPPSVQQQRAAWLSPAPFASEP